MKKLKADGALPDLYVVENYRPLPVAPGYVNAVGPESNPNSIAAVATWVAENAPVAADSDEAGRLFQSEAGHAFQLDRGHPTDLIPAG